MGGVGDFKGGLDSDAVVVSKRAREAPAYQRQSRKPSVKYVYQTTALHFIMTTGRCNVYLYASKQYTKVKAAGAAVLQLIGPCSSTLAECCSVQGDTIVSVVLFSIIATEQRRSSHSDQRADSKPTVTL
jgi:hypothetical protein